MLGAIRKKSKGWVAYFVVGLIIIPLALCWHCKTMSVVLQILLLHWWMAKTLIINLYFREVRTLNKETLQQQLGAQYSQEIDNVLKQSIMDTMINEKLIENLCHFTRYGHFGSRSAISNSIESSFSN